jgi:hypothetical protein
MVLSVHSNADMLVRDFILSYDQFQLALPCWNRRVTQLLPPEHRRISIQELNNMALRIIPVEHAPIRTNSSRMNSNADFNAVLDAVKNTANRGKAFVVSMEDPAWTTVKNGKPVYPKPEIAFAYTLRRWFEKHQLAIVAYQSGKMEVTVRAMTSTEITNTKRK